VAIAALIYADFSAKRRKDVKFSWQDILNFDGETGPYLQYTSVRIRSVLEKFTGKIIPEVDFNKLTHPEEKELIKHLANFSTTVVVAAEEKEPFIVAHYLMDLAKLFNKFYSHYRVLDEDGETSLARVLLTYCTSTVLDAGLKLLGIPLPKKM
jgi:arginyl-tRNA synthetase